MNYNWHTRINTLLLTGMALLFLDAGMSSPEEVAGFWIIGMFHTVLVSPDIDHKKSKPTRRMGLIGKITSAVFKHRGLLHNPYFWTVVYIGLHTYVSSMYGYDAWWLCGGLLAIYIHIALDVISTGTKRTITKVKRKLHI